MLWKEGRVCDSGSCMNALQHSIFSKAKKMIQIAKSAPILKIGQVIKIDSIIILSQFYNICHFLSFILLKIINKVLIVIFLILSLFI